MILFGRLLLGAALAFVPGAALACSCDDPLRFTEAQVEKAARYLVDEAMIVAEVERVDTAARSQPQQFRVTRTLLGAALPARLLLPAAESRPYVTSCDYDLKPGYRGLAIFRTADQARPRSTCSVLATAEASSTIRLAGLCTYGLLENPAILRRAVELSGAQAGVKRSSRPRSSSR